MNLPCEPDLFKREWPSTQYSGEQVSLSQFVCILLSVNLSLTVARKRLQSKTTRPFYTFVCFMKEVIHKTDSSVLTNKR